jgi:hypothetical protein
MSSTEQRALVAFSVSIKPAVAIPECQSVVTLMTNNPNFPTASTLLATTETDLTALAKATADAKNKVPGAVAIRKAALIKVKSDAGSLKALVQSTADANPASAAAIILSAGMRVRKAVTRSKTALTATWGDVSGVVLLIAKAVANRASYLWQWSLDGKTWNTLPSTLQAHTTVNGLTPATTYFFRFRATLKIGEQDWSQTVSLLVK